MSYYDELEDEEEQFDGRQATFPYGLNTEPPPMICERSPFWCAPDPLPGDEQSPEPPANCETPGPDPAEPAQHAPELDDVHTPAPAEEIPDCWDPASYVPPPPRPLPQTNYELDREIEELCERMNACPQLAGRILAEVEPYVDDYRTDEAAVEATLRFMAAIPRKFQPCVEPVDVHPVSAKLYIRRATTKLAAAASYLSDHVCTRRVSANAVRNLYTLSATLRHLDDIASGRRSTRNNNKPGPKPGRGGQRPGSGRPRTRFRPPSTEDDDETDDPG